MSVPSVSLPSLRSPSSSAYTQLVLRDKNDECWRCGNKSSDVVQVAHQLFAHERTRFSLYCDEPLNVISQNMPHLAHLGNLLPLCQNCHISFDANSPSWVMVPEDMGFLIDWENSDYDRRIAAGKQGTRTTRNVPTAVDYTGNLYNVYSIRQEGLAPVDESRFPKVWGSEPTAAFLKSVLGICQPSLNVPREIREKTIELANLYSRPMPWVNLDNGEKEILDGKVKVQEGSRDGMSGKDGSRKGSAKDGQKGHRNREPEQSPQRKRTRSGRVPGKKTRNISQGEAYHTPPTSLLVALNRGAPIVPVDQVRAWGPQFSVRDVVKQFTTIKNE